jgi:hypothetical protein
MTHDRALNIESYYVYNRRYFYTLCVFVGFVTISYVIFIQACPISADSVSAVSVIGGLPWPPKNLKINEINSS